MPRIKENKEKYLLSDFSSWVIGQLHDKHLRQSDLAKELGITQQALSKKLSKHNFTLKDLIRIFKVFETDKETITKLLT